MKINTILLGMLLLSVGFSSCKNVVEQKAQETVDAFQRYADSLINMTGTGVKEDFGIVEARFKKKAEVAEAAIENLKDKVKIQEKIDVSKAKFEKYKSQFEAKLTEEKNRIAKDREQALRNSFFGNDKVREDLDFSWVKKNDIINVYKEFIATFDKNRDSYSKEDFDKIKQMYKALDSRKNVLQKEGLSAKDTIEIAKLKLEFASKFKGKDRN